MISTCLQQSTLGDHCCLQPLLYGSTWEQVQLANQMLSHEGSDRCHGPQVIKVSELRLPA